MWVIWSLLQAECYCSALGLAHTQIWCRLEIWEMLWILTKQDAWKYQKDIRILLCRWGNRIKQFFGKYKRIQNKWGQEEIKPIGSRSHQAHWLICVLLNVDPNCILFEGYLLAMAKPYAPTKGCFPVQVETHASSASASTRTIAVWLGEHGQLLVLVAQVQTCRTRGHILKWLAWAATCITDVSSKQAWAQLVCVCLLKQGSMLPAAM